MIADDFLGLRFTAKGRFNDDLGRLMSAVLRFQMRRSPRYFRGFVLACGPTKEPT